MRAAGVLLVILAACAAEGIGDDSYPVTPPGVSGQGTSTGGGGSGGGGGGGGGLLTARVCILTDSTKLDSCNTTVEAGIKVQMQNGVGERTLAGSTLASGSGIVTATPPPGGVAYWVITPPDPPLALGNPIFRSFVQYDPRAAKSAAGQRLPVFLEADYVALTGAHGALFDESEGAIFATAVDGGSVPFAGAKATIVPATPRASWYADTNADAWTQDAVAGTTAKGLVWFPGLPGGGLVTTSFNKGTLHGEKALARLLASYTTFLTIPLQ